MNFDWLLKWMFAVSPNLVIDVVAVVVGVRLLKRHRLAGRLLMVAGSLQFLSFFACFGSRYAIYALSDDWLGLPIDAVVIGFSLLQPVCFLLFVAAAVVGRRHVILAEMKASNEELPHVRR